MLLLGSFKAMKKQQLFWIMFCVLSLTDNKVSSGDMSSTVDTSLTTISTTLTSITPAMTTDSVTQPTAFSKTENISGTSEASTVEMTTTMETTAPATSTGPTQRHLTASDQSESVNISSSLQPSSPGIVTDLDTSKVSTATTVSPEQTSHSVTAEHTSSPKPEHFITCQNIKHVLKPNGICLFLNESDTCNNFVNSKGKKFIEVICGIILHSPPICHIELAKSEVKPSCLMLIQAGDKDAEAIEKLLQGRESNLTELGIKPHKLESIGCHQDFSRRTLIALVTSGLLLAFLGLAGYFLMKRRSWSPIGERLAEDPYCTDNDSQGNTVITVASQEPSEPQEKPNLNGGAQKNGTGQASSKNGHSAKQHVVADTEL